MNNRCIPCGCVPTRRFVPGPPGMPGPQGPQGPAGESAPDYDLPIVHRIMTDATYQGNFYPLLLELDRPAPANCYLQFYRYSRKRRNRGRDRDYSMPSRTAFRGIFVDGNSNVFPVIPIPQGATVVTLSGDEWDEIYRPAIVRTAYREWDDAPEGRPRWSPVNRIRENKVIYKFGTCVYLRGESFRAGRMSADTLTIIRHYSTSHNQRQIQYRTYMR